MTQEKRALEDIALKYTQLGSPFERHVRHFLENLRRFESGAPLVDQLV